MGAAEAGPDPSLDAYAEPQRLVKLNTRRRLNLCVLGNGPATVVFAAGLAGFTGHWARVQPAIARRALTVAFDKAGFGFSDPGPLPRSAAATVADLRIALRRIGAAPPYVLVGHSLGGLEMRLYAYLHAEEVAALVLVDPTSEDYQREVFKHPAMREWSRRDYAEVRRVYAMAKGGTLVPGTPAHEARVGPPSPELPDRLNAAVLKNRASPGYWRATLSMIRQQRGPDLRVMAGARRRLGDTPIVVLSATQTLDAVRAQAGEAAAAYLQKSHQGMAAESTRGVWRAVECGHGIQWERPDAVIAAVEEVLQIGPLCRDGTV